VQRLLEGEQDGHRHGTGHGYRHVAEHGVGAEKECQQRCHDARDAEVVLAGGLEPTEQCESGREGQEGSSQNQRTANVR
jgi:hypothetical protein